MKSACIVVLTVAFACADAHRFLDSELRSVNGYHVPIETRLSTLVSDDSDLSLAHRVMVVPAFRHNTIVTDQNLAREKRAVVEVEDTLGHTGELVSSPVVDYHLRKEKVDLLSNMDRDFGYRTAFVPSTFGVHSGHLIRSGLPLRVGESTVVTDRSLARKKRSVFPLVDTFGRTDELVSRPVVDYLRRKEFVDRVHQDVYL